jgi:hypothetical protein
VVVAVVVDQATFQAISVELAVDLAWPVVPVGAHALPYRLLCWVLDPLLSPNVVVHWLGYSVRSC